MFEVNHQKRVGGRRSSLSGAECEERPSQAIPEACRVRSMQKFIPRLLTDSSLSFPGQPRRNDSTWRFGRGKAASEIELDDWSTRQTAVGLLVAGSRQTFGQPRCPPLTRNMHRPLDCYWGFADMKHEGRQGARRESQPFSVVMPLILSRRCI
ncbi:hypothetical protein BDW71DRAFT_63409 [Aspergillus fruticulosus]